jgi:acyl carrier protein
MNSPPWPPEFERALRSQLPLLAPETPLDPNVELYDLGLDSLGIVALLSALEAEFDVEFPDEILNRELVDSAQNLWMAVKSLRAEQAHSGPLDARTT